MKKFILLLSLIIFISCDKETKELENTLANVKNFQPIQIYTKSSIAKTTTLFYKTNSLVNDLVSDSEEKKELKEEIQKELSKLHVTEFPKMRQAYAKLLNDEYREFNTSVNCLDNGNKTISFKGSKFDEKSYIRKYNNTMVKYFREFRFNKVIYNSQEINIISKDDSEI